MKLSTEKVLKIIELAKNQTREDNIKGSIPELFDEIENYSENLDEKYLPFYLMKLSSLEIAELTALMWLGRGDISSEMFNNTVGRENTEDNYKKIGYLVGKSKLAKYLSEGVRLMRY